MNEELRKSIITIITAAIIGLGVYLALQHYKRTTIEAPPTIIREPRAQVPVIEPDNEKSPEEVVEDRIETQAPIAKKLYKGYWFDVEYPENFDVSPTEPINYHEGVRMILTDQAYFTSPNGEVEFYVYSPLWAGYPEYLDMLSTEVLVSEEVTERDVTSGGAEIKRKNRVTFKTYKEKNGLYMRSIALYENSIYEGQDFPETSHVFGVKYSSEASYNKYRQDYLDFKQSLMQYAD